MLKAVAIGKHDTMIESSNHKKLKWFVVLFIIMTLPSVMKYTSLIEYPALWWPIEGIFMIIGYSLRDRFWSIPPVKWYLIWVLVASIHGLFLSSNYWDWKLLVSNIMIYFIPILCYSFIKPHIVIATLGGWYKYAPIIIIVMIPFATMHHFWGRALMPFSFLLLFFPILPTTFKWYSLIAFGLVITLGFSDRSDMIRFIVSFLLGISAYQRYEHVMSNLYKPLAKIMCFAPLVFVALALTGQFNILKIGEEMGWEYKVDDGSGGHKDYFSDDRTGLFEEAIESAIDMDYVWCGHSLARGYKSHRFGKGIDKVIGLSRGERGTSEVCCINIFTYMGIVGLFLFMVLFIKAVYNAIWFSQSKYMKTIGLLVGFRWFYCWLEEYQRYDTNTLILFIMVGMCYSPFFLKMEDCDFEEFIENMTTKWTLKN